ncbi:unnamed protein product [Paramecium octaurelia]|uniref:Uncharacterized protein n=1 Tax=Paramecium octaurelia TaxID=43137 RepID=A0A8S1XZC6_PAROT|nr:unnamed protein product [Paramecium octaurelia]
MKQTSSKEILKIRILCVCSRRKRNNSQNQQMLQIYAIIKKNLVGFYAKNNQSIRKRKIKNQAIENRNLR